jgi:hypothetical protein
MACISNLRSLPQRYLPEAFIQIQRHNYPHLVRANNPNLDFLLDHHNFGLTLHSLSLPVQLSTHSPKLSLYFPELLASVV